MSGFRVSIEAALGDAGLRVSLQGDRVPLALVGPNGSGKTTVLRIIAGAQRPIGGEIVVGDRTLFSSARGIDVASEQRRVGYVPQGYGLFPHLPVLDNVAFGLSVGTRRQPRAMRHRAAHAMLKALECPELAKRSPESLSGGEQQRVALARALVIDPAMLLLDEPLSALDAATRRRVRSFLAARLLSLGRPSIVVTHDVRDVAALGAHVCVLEQGRIVQQGTIDDLHAAPASEFVAEFVGHDPPKAVPPAGGK
ncbi:MAG: ABC transporter ATP-binding protein [Myxococcales bacterium]|nr:ABC transporter ATP-binding protein [Myxococcales bacterium]